MQDVPRSKKSLHVAVILKRHRAPKKDKYAFLQLLPLALLFGEIRQYTLEDIHSLVDFCLGNNQARDKS